MRALWMIFLLTGFSLMVRADDPPLFAYTCIGPMTKATFERSTVRLNPVNANECKRENAAIIPTFGQVGRQKECPTGAPFCVRRDDFINSWNALTEKDKEQIYNIYFNAGETDTLAMIISATQVQGNLSCMWYYTGLPNPTQIQTTATKDCTQKLICAGTVRCIGKDNFGVKRNGNEEIVTITCNAQVAGECPGATDCYNKENVGYTIVGATYKTEENTYAPQVPQSQRR